MHVVSYRAKEDEGTRAYQLNTAACAVIIQVESILSLSTLDTILLHHYHYSYLEGTKQSDYTPVLFSSHQNCTPWTSTNPPHHPPLPP